MIKKFKYIVEAMFFEFAESKNNAPTDFTILFWRFGLPFFRIIEKKNPCIHRQNIGITQNC